MLTFWHIMELQPTILKQKVPTTLESDVCEVLNQTFPDVGLEGMDQYSGQNVHQWSHLWISIYGPVLKILCMKQKYDTLLN